MNNRTTLIDAMDGLTKLQVLKIELKDQLKKYNSDYGDNPELYESLIMDTQDHLNNIEAYEQDIQDILEQVQVCNANFRA